MKQLIFILIMFYGVLYGNINVDYENNLPSEIVITKVIDDVEYFRIMELDKILNCSIEKDKIWGNITLNIFGGTFLFKVDSPFFSYDNRIFNLGNNVIYKDGKFWLPTIFLYRTLPTILPERISYNKETDSLVILKPQLKNIDLIVIDPGHGGKDPGAIGYSKKHYEKDLVLKISKLLKQKLEKELNVKTYLTRSHDEYVRLNERCKFANQKKAMMFISIHLNSSKNSKANGVEVYFLSSAKTTDERAVQQLENSVVYEYEDEENQKHYSDLDFILMDMAQNEYLVASSELALKIQNRLVEKTGFYNRGVKQAGFYVLKDAFMPAVLIEAGFISNKYEEQKIIKSSYQNKIADAIFLGVKEFIDSYE